MAIFCMNCGVNLVDDYVIRNGEEIPNPYVVCGNCGEWAGIPVPKTPPQGKDKEAESFDKLLENEKDFVIRGGKVGSK